MKPYKLKPLLIAACCFVTAMWTEIRGAEESNNDGERAALPPNMSCSSSFLTGSIIAFSGDENSITPGCGWLLCDGTQVSSLKYPELYMVIGEKYVPENIRSFLVERNSVAVLEKTFYLPDLRGCVIVGVDGGAGRVTSNNTLGASGGEEACQLTEQQLARHTHTVTSTGGGHTHIVGCMTGNVTINPAPEISSISGDDQPHNNMQPYLVLNYIINTGEMNNKEKLNILEERQKEQAELHKKKEKILSIRESRIDRLINQYKLLIADYVPYGTVNQALNDLLELSAAQVNEESLAQVFPISTNMQYIQTYIKLLLKAIAFTNQDNIANPIANLGKIEILRIIKENILESMELYKELHGHSHSRWDEFNNI